MPQTRAQRAKALAAGSEQNEEAASSGESTSMSKRPKLGKSSTEGSNGSTNFVETQFAEVSLIMKSIFAHLFPFKDLKNFRQVSKLWYTESLKYWRNIAVIRLTHPIVEDVPTPSPEGWNIADFLEKLQSNDQFYKLHQYPYKKYHFVSIPIQNEENEPHNTLEQFGNSIGPLVTHLEVDSCTFYPRTSKAFEKFITERLPNLQNLVLTKNHVLPNGCRMSNPHVPMVRENALAVYQAKTRNWNLKRIKLGGGLPMGLMALMLSAPNIETLEFGQDFDTKNKHIFQFYLCFRLMHDFRRIIDQRPFQIKNLDLMDIDWYKGPTHVDIKAFWLSTEYPLENLALTLSNVNCTKIEDVRTIMVPTVRHLANSLKVLTVFRPPVYEMTFKNAFPINMSILEELYLHGNIVWDFGFLEKMPNLKTLFIDYKCYEQDKRIAEMFYKTHNMQDIEDFRNLYRPFNNFDQIRQPVVSPNMERLHLNFRPDVFLESIRTCMSNLKTLEAVLWQNEFRLVCRELPNLEELVLLYDSRIDDDTFTGLVDGSEIRHPQNITSLQCLKKLEIQTLCSQPENPRFDARLGNKAVYKGLLELSTLEYVTICASSQMTTEAEIALRQHVAYTKIIRNYGSNNHGEEDCCRVAQFISYSQHE